MNYETAKKLEKAGFPQPSGKVELKGKYIYKAPKCFKSACYDPSLSELIKECEPNITGLRKTAPERGSMKARWIAEGHPYQMDNMTEFLKEIGKTPEEAVANLYLKLKEK